MNSTLADILGADTPEYKRHLVPPLDSGIDPNFGDRLSQEEVQRGIKTAIDEAIVNLDAVKKLLTDRFEGKVVAAPPPTPAPTPAPHGADPSTDASANTSTNASANASTNAPHQPQHQRQRQHQHQRQHQRQPRRQRRRQHHHQPRNPHPCHLLHQRLFQPRRAPLPPAGRRIAILGQRAGAASEAVSGFVTQLGLEAIPLRDPSDTAGGAYIDRLDALRGVDYAIVLLSEGEAALLEIGFLLGAIGRARMCFVVAGNRCRRHTGKEWPATRSTTPGCGACCWRARCARPAWMSI